MRAYSRFCKRARKSCDMIQWVHAVDRWGKEEREVSTYSGSLGPLIARIHETRFRWCREDLPFQAVKSSGEIYGGDLWGLRIEVHGW